MPTKSLGSTDHSNLDGETMGHGDSLTSPEVKPEPTVTPPASAVLAPLAIADETPTTRVVTFARELAEHLPELERSLTDRIRREFFARAAVSAERYGVTLDDVLHHLRDANLGLTPGSARVLSFLDDVVTAVACVRGHPRAWHDAWQRHESPLIRACNTRLDDADAIIFTRRFWISLYTTTVTNRPPQPRPQASIARGEHADAGRPSGELWPMSTYVGVRPLRIWLTDRLMGLLEHAVVRAHRGVAAAADPMTLGSDGAGSSGGLPESWMREGFVFRALRRRSRAARTDIRLRLVD